MQPSRPLAGRDSAKRPGPRPTGTLVLAMREPGGAFRTNPPPTAEIVAGEVLIVIGDSGQVAALRVRLPGSRLSHQVQ